MKAWIENGIVRDIAHSDPHLIYTPDIAAHYSVDVPDTTKVGDSFVAGVWSEKVVAIEVAQETEAPKPPKVSVIEYKMLFTSAERIATKACIDPVIVDLQELMNDPRTLNVDLSLKSISDALDYMTAIGLIAEGRKAQILTGVIQ